MLSRLQRDFPVQFFEQSIKSLLSLLILALLGIIGAGVMTTFIDLWDCLLEVVHGGKLHEGFRWLLVDVLTVLALVEVFRTAMVYFTEGRVKVTYIIDTVLVAVLTEVLAFWYRDIEPSRMAMVVVLVVSLMFVRIMAIRFSPRRRDLSEGL
ncbi:MAG: hypothetical protein A2X84_00315 [Desulfuromonadaceae bacterium GWC2_58_13]|nr:MAG: hypothetical protein A2X84_00315 [Desulfuromonadaceae bacterium GWC2_58_13]